MDIHIATRQVQDECGKPHRFRYFLTVDVIETGSFCCEDYGVLISEDGVRSARVPSLTTSALRIDQLMTTLVDNAVGPVGLRDVIDDWL